MTDTADRRRIAAPRWLCLLGGGLLAAACATPLEEADLTGQDAYGVSYPDECCEGLDLYSTGPGYFPDVELYATPDGHALRVDCETDPLALALQAECDRLGVRFLWVPQPVPEP